MTVVPPQGLILVTGVNGLIASVIVKTFLDRGYKVRGTVRSIAKYDWMPSYFGPNFSLVEVPELSADNALAEAAKGVDGIAHVAADLSFNPDPVVIDRAVKTTIGVLETAAKEASVKRVVITSSANACVDQTPGVPYKINSESFNQGAIDKSKETWDGEGPIDRGRIIYSASKALSEIKAYEWVRENKPSFVFNTVVPNYNMGPPAAPDKLGFGSGTGILASLIRTPAAAKAILGSFGSEWYVYIEDTALLHLGALTVEDVQNERLFAMGSQFSWGEIFDIMVRNFPEKTSALTGGYDGASDLGEVDNTRATEVLRKLGQDGFRSLEYGIVEAVKSVIALEAVPDRPLSAAEQMIEGFAKSLAQ